jgi:hypothetical protein
MRYGPKTRDSWLFRPLQLGKMLAERFQEEVAHSLCVLPFPRESFVLLEFREIGFRQRDCNPPLHLVRFRLWWPTHLCLLHHPQILIISAISCIVSVFNRF